MVGEAPLSAGAGLGLELVDEVADVEEAAPGAGPEAGASDGHGEVGLAGPGTADQHEIALVLEEATADQVA